MSKKCVNSDAVGRQPLVSSGWSKSIVMGQSLILPEAGWETLTDFDKSAGRLFAPNGLRQVFSCRRGEQFTQIKMWRIVVVSIVAVIQPPLISGRHLSAPRLLTSLQFVTDMYPQRVPHGLKST